jgi:hypothetical protein
MFVLMAVATTLATSPLVRALGGREALAPRPEESACATERA